jgi:glycosyltransferase involved in cell wall biosynthesis
VEWVGAVHGEAKSDLLRSADVFVFPSYYHFECQPLVIIEAMASGKAIIASDEAAIPDLISDHVDGLLVRARAVDELVEALCVLLSYPALRAKLGAAARARYEAAFTSEKFEQTLADTLWRIVVPSDERPAQVRPRTELRRLRRAG